MPAITSMINIKVASKILLLVFIIGLIIVKRNVVS
jgi:hypothetical protein